MAPTDVLVGVVAYVACASSGVLQTREILSLKLQELGARVVGRLTRDVTHIVCCKGASSPHGRKNVEEIDILSLYEKATKVIILQIFYTFSSFPPMTALAIWFGLAVGIKGIRRFSALGELLC